MQAVRLLTVPVRLSVRSVNCSFARHFSLSEMAQRPKILVTNNSLNVDRLREVGDVTVNPKNGIMDRAALLEMSKDVDAIFCLLTDRIDSEFLDNAKKLKVVGTMSVGYEHIDVKACKERKVAICNTPGVLTETVAELTIALLLAACRRIPEAVDEARNGGWAEWKPYWLCGKDIRGSTVGVFGMGRIGRSVAAKLKVFGPKEIIYHSRSADCKEYDFVPFDDLLSQSDFLIICATSNPQTVDLFDESVLRKMKKDAILVNTSRGNLVKMDDLAKVLEEGHLFSAGLDVTNPEPFPVDHKLFQLKNCVILPHIGSASIQTRDGMANMAMDGIIAGLKGEISEGMKEFLDK